ncbi:hypothetical protein O181_085308 [Austropuccinia psidii MF-1]|uniref:Uncharacterized protein n=1 Tax=Austropuccinia psidii MF-1 TaxID=1389203 RepID=A0A9Q3FX95_9BASI|nr:hypothetical protein [Austropuccinia psidii MF-1]
MKRVGPKAKIEAWGLRIWQLAREANDGRIWQLAREANDGRIWQLGREANDGRIWQLGREANDGRIWPEDIIGQGRVIWPKGHRAPEGTKSAIKIWCGELAPTWSQVGIAATPIEEGHSAWL